MWSGSLLKHVQMFTIMMRSSVVNWSSSKNMCCVLMLISSCNVLLVEWGQTYVSFNPLTSMSSNLISCGPVKGSGKIWGTCCEGERIWRITSRITLVMNIFWGLLGICVKIIRETNLVQAKTVSDIYTLTIITSHYYLAKVKFITLNLGGINWVIPWQWLNQGCKLNYWLKIHLTK